MPTNPIALSGLKPYNKKLDGPFGQKQIDGGMHVKREEFKALSENDFLIVLNTAGILQRFYAGEITCSACGRVVSIDNVLSMKRNEFGIKLFCNHPLCVGE
jgi:hypothetical protein